MKAKGRGIREIYKRKAHQNYQTLLCRYNLWSRKVESSQFQKMTRNACRNIAVQLTCLQSFQTYPLATVTNRYSSKYTRLLSRALTHFLCKSSVLDLLISFTNLSCTATNQSSSFSMKSSNFSVCFCYPDMSDPEHN